MGVGAALGVRAPAQFVLELPLHTWTPQLPPERELGQLAHRHPRHQRCRSALRKLLKLIPASLNHLAILLYYGEMLNYADPFTQSSFPIMTSPSILCRPNRGRFFPLLSRDMTLKLIIPTVLLQPVPCSLLDALCCITNSYKDSRTGLTSRA